MDTKLKQKNSQIKEHRIYLCCDSLKQITSNNIFEDFIFGCNFGDLTGLIENKIIILRENAHSDSINSIKISKLEREVYKIYLKLVENIYFNRWRR